MRAFDSTPRLAHRWTQVVHRARYLISTGLGIWAFALLAVRARGKPFWHDEIYTILSAALTPITDWRARLDGLDLSPPLHAWLTHLIHLVAGVGPITTRLPSLLSFLLAMFTIFLLVSRRTTTVVGLCASALLCFTPAWNAAYEARGYALTCACFAVALYGWAEGRSSRGQPRHRAAMSIALAAGLWTHLFFVVAWIPMVVGEAVWQWRRRRVEWASWLAFVGAGVASLPLLALVRANGGQRLAFWARYTTPDWWEVYESTIGQLRLYNLRVAAGLIVALVIFEITRRVRDRHWPAGLPSHEVVAGLCCLALPAAGAALGGLLGIFTVRYITFASVGLVVVLPIAAWLLTPRNGLPTGLLAMTVVYSMAQLTRHTFIDLPTWPTPSASHPLLTRALAEPYPLFVTGSIDYLPTWYYASPQVRPRVRYLADVAGERRETGADTIDRGYLALAGWTAVPVVSVTALDREMSFRLYTWSGNWVVSSLEARGATLVTIASDTGGVLYDVKLPR